MVKCDRCGGMSGYAFYGACLDCIHKALRATDGRAAGRGDGLRDCALCGSPMAVGVPYGSPKGWGVIYHICSKFIFEMRGDISAVRDAWGRMNSGARLLRAEAELEELRARVGHFGQWASAYKILLGNAAVLAEECAELLSGHDELVERLDRFVIEAEGYK